MRVSWVVGAAIGIRILAAVGGYSGKSTPPKFGDFEAQRHWMELTYHLPSAEWYRPSDKNDLEWWGLDYPPLTAYGSWLCGWIAHHIDPAFVALHDSRGTESPALTLFMRATVMVADVLVLVPASIAMARVVCGPRSFEGALAMVLLHPALVLVDHGHFQYNGISLGFTLWAAASIDGGWERLGASLFTLALNYKQMSLYHALPFFGVLLGRCIAEPTWTACVRRLSGIGGAVVTVFGTLWFPFLGSIEDSSWVLHRLFPVARGLFEDKVANVWCMLDVPFKLRARFALQTLTLFALVATLLASLPSCVQLVRKPTARSFRYSLVVVSLAFFLFSFQVHEKSILLPAIAVSFACAP